MKEYLSALIDLFFPREEADEDGFPLRSWKGIIGLFLMLAVLIYLISGALN